MNHNVLVPVHIDSETGDVWRSPDTGFAKRLPYEQGGELLVKLPSRAAWPGYFGSDEATRKKLLENVFETGDIYWRTGDALRRDDNGHWYFMDRLGMYHFAQSSAIKIANDTDMQAIHIDGKEKTSQLQKSPKY